MPRFRSFRWEAWAEAAYLAWREDRPTILAVDTETEGVEFYDAAFCGTVTWRSPYGALRNWYFEFAEADTRAQLREILLGTHAWVGANMKFDLQKGILEGVFTRTELDLHEIHDVQTQFMLLDENSPKGLKKLAVSVLKHKDVINVPTKSGINKGKDRWLPREEYILGEVRKKLGLTKKDGYHLLPRQVLVPYAMRDTEFTLRLHEVLYPQLAKRDPRLVEIYHESMQRKVDLLDMEADGFGVDLEYLEQAASDKGVEVMETWQGVIDKAGFDLNPNSPDQILKAFASRGVHLPDTQADTLKKLTDPLAVALLAYRDVKKVHDYLRELRRIQRDGIAHPNFNDDGAKTGRMSSGVSEG
jgi:DNA polymerase I-like protein with 3'-5' exonuclease and polymerase domains